MMYTSARVQTGSKKKKSTGKRILKGFLYFLLFLVLIFAGLIGYIVMVGKLDPPQVADKSALQLQRKALDQSAYTIGNNWFRKSKSGLYELYVEGKPFERGVIYGKLADELVKRQEDHFTEQIRKMIPSTTYLKFLRYLIGFFNRNLDEYVIDEYKKEIYGVSFAGSPNYGYIGNNYERIMNYHAAHDIGHALQSVALVGCTSFATWDEQSADSSLIIGRNFDFYVGDKFAEEKIVAFYKPSEGHKFMMITWAGFTGVVSGMNDQGLTVTINAAKSEYPTGAATPVSLVAREILQYAGNIKEAYAIAAKRKMFVSESFLVGSAADNRAAIIEKTPDSLGMYTPGQHFVTCTNHFQSDQLKNTVSNEKQMAESASMYRYERLRELMERNGPNTVQNTVNILRDHRGLHDKNIGIGNEKAINQFIAHHSIVFKPKERKFWISTAPWQEGEYVAYDMNKIFEMKGLQTDHEICDSALIIPADTFMRTDTFRNFLTYRKLKAEVADHKKVDPAQIVASNPMFYHAFVLAGDQAFKDENYRIAKDYYQQALMRVIATKAEEVYIRKQIDACDEKSLK